MSSSTELHRLEAMFDRLWPINRSIAGPGLLPGETDDLTSWRRTKTVLSSDQIASNQAQTVASPNVGDPDRFIYAIDDFNVQNGATMFWPYSHQTGRKPPEGVVPQELPGRVQPEAARGSAIFFLGSIWHKLPPNLSRARRW